MGFHFNKGKFWWESQMRLLSLLLSTSEKFKNYKNPFNLSNISMKTLRKPLAAASGA